MCEEIIINEENINHVTCSDPTEAKTICVSPLRPMCIYVQQPKLIDYLNLPTC